MSKPQSKCPYQPIKNDRKDPDISDDIEKNNKGKAKANPWQNDLQGMAKKGGQQGKGGQKKSYGIMHTILFMIPILFKGNCQTKFQLLLTILLTLCAKVLAVTHPIVLKYIIDSLILGESSYYLIAIYIAVRIFSEICNQLREVAFAAISASAEVCITSKVYNHIQNQSLSFHLSRETGRIITICSRGSQSFANVLKFCFFNIGPLILEIGLVVFSVGFMLPVYFWILILFSMVLYILDTYVLTEWRAKYFRDMNNKSNAYNQKATDSLLNFETVKYFNAENHEQRRYNRALTEYASQNVITNNSMVVLNLSQNFCVFIGLICNLMLGAYMIDTRTINAGDFVMLNTYFFQIYSPLFFLGTYWRVIRQAMVDVEQVFEILDSDQSIKDPINPESLLKGQGEIEFKNVSFAYESNPNKLIIDNLSFKIEAGKSVAIVGATGSGKSTIVRLLYRFYDVTGGKIFVDGQDISKLRISDHRSKISVVPQDTVLFN